MTQRGKAIEYLNSLSSNGTDIDQCLISIGKAKIAAKIAAEPEWIPVSEGLPDEQKPILFYWDNGYNGKINRQRCSGFYTHGGILEDSEADEEDVYFPAGFYEQIYDEEKCYQQAAVAWMYYPELPEPFKPETK